MFTLEWQANYYSCVILIYIIQFVQCFCTKYFLQNFDRPPLFILSYKMSCKVNDKQGKLVGFQESPVWAMYWMSGHCCPPQRAQRYMCYIGNPMKIVLLKCNTVAVFPVEMCFYYLCNVHQFMYFTVWCMQWTCVSLFWSVQWYDSQEACLDSVYLLCDHMCVLCKCAMCENSLEIFLFGKSGVP